MIHVWKCTSENWALLGYCAASKGIFDSELNECKPDLKTEAFLTRAKDLLIEDMDIHPSKCYALHADSSAFNL